MDDLKGFYIQIRIQVPIKVMSYYLLLRVENKSEKPRVTISGGNEDYNLVSQYVCSPELPSYKVVSRIDIYLI
jgi:hypothetical protein